MTNEPRRRGRPRKNPLPEQQVGIAAKDVDTSEQPAIEAQAEVFDTPAALKVHMYPKFTPGSVGGIPRVVEGMVKHLPSFGIEIVDDPEEADVIACHATVPSSYIKRFPTKTFVAICHGLYWAEYAWGNQQLKANEDVGLNIKVADAVIACSEWVANAIRRGYSRDVEVIYHGIDSDEWRADENKGYVLWNKFRTDPVCDPEPLNQVAKLLPNVGFVSTFAVNAPNIATTGMLEPDQAKILVQKAGAYLCTTRETFGIGTLEALSCGVPIVGYNWGGQAEFIEHGVDGWLSKPGDIKDLAAGINWALQNHERLAPACRAKAEQFSWQRAAEKYARVFKDTFEAKTKSGPRTSIIVTNYNLHKYLEDCLASVQNQSDEDWECIVVDDASTDKTGIDIINSFVEKDKRFKLIVNEQNEYLAEARNVGIRNASGRYVLPLDADDMLTDNAVRILADALDFDRTIGVAYGNVLFVEEDGEKLTDFGWGLKPGRSTWPWQFTFEQQIKERNLLPYASMYRREAWRQTGGYRRRCRTAEDADMWTRLSSYGFTPRMVTDEDTLVYRSRHGSMSVTQGAVHWTDWFTWAKIPEITPPAALMQDKQPPVPSYDPITISVIIPVGPGHEKLFMDAVDSVDAQLYRNWECIVVNDTGSPLAGPLPSWVRLVNTEGKRGPGAARNAGIAVSKGRLFLPLDADDYLMPEALLEFYNAHLQSEDVIYSDFWQTDHATGKQISLHKCDDYDPQLILGRKRNFEGELRQGMIHSVTALTPKWAWERVGGYDESLTGWEDWDFQIALANIGVCSRRVSAPLFLYRKNTGFRRDENYDSFERNKEAILRKWGHFWEGGQELMACGSCRARATIQPSASMFNQSSSPKNMAAGDAVLMEYEGDRAGAIGYRGPSRTMYYFGNGDRKYVLNQDVSMFLNMKGFSIVEPTPEFSEPALFADGPPAR